MTPEQQRIAIAEACGWTRQEALRGFSTVRRVIDGVGYNQISEHIPDYLNDLNAMHSAIMTLSKAQRHEVNCVLLGICTVTQSWSCCDEEHWSVTVDATAAQRAEAFLKTLNLWKP